MWALIAASINFLWNLKQKIKSPDEDPLSGYKLMGCKMSLKSTFWLESNLGAVSNEHTKYFQIDMVSMQHVGCLPLGTGTVTLRQSTNTSSYTTCEFIMQFPLLCYVFKFMFFCFTQNQKVLVIFAIQRNLWFLLVSWYRLKNQMGSVHC